MNLKMLLEVLTDQEIEELKERAIRQQNFYAANLLRWEADERFRPMAKPVQSPFVRCKDACVMLGGRCILNGANAPIGSHPLDGVNDWRSSSAMTLKPRNGASRGASCPELALFFPAVF
jgi:hypothetical protein